MKNTKAVTHTAQHLRDELKTLVGEAQAMITDTVSDYSADTLENLRERFTAAQERMGDFYAGAKKKVVAGAKSTDSAIRDNPYQSMAISIGVGLLIGVLLGRRGR
jgi:ElaB/YqjD/DUF883 family membrane-anchored ribosome-binding protein